MYVNHAVDLIPNKSMYTKIDIWIKSGITISDDLALVVNTSSNTIIVASGLVAKVSEAMEGFCLNLMESGQ